MSSSEAGAEMMTFFAPASQVLARVPGLGEPPGGLDDHVHPEVAPGQRRGVPLGEHADLRVADQDRVAVHAHVLRQGAQHRVVFEQVGQRSGVGQVVRGDDLDLLGATVPRG